jgi:RNA polymerase sigma-70 factor, ECF subfamily
MAAELSRSPPAATLIPRAVSRDSPATPESFPAHRAEVIRLPVGLSDEGIVHGLKNGDREAAAQLFDRYAEHLRRVLVRVLGPDPEIPDLLQDVMVAALGSINRLDDARALRAWLTRIAVFTARVRIRRRTRWRFLRFVAPEELPEQGVEPHDAPASETLRATYRVLEKLDSDERIAFALRFLHGMELTEVAHAASVSLATIKRRLSRAQLRFQELARSEPSLDDWLGGLS